MEKPGGEDRGNNPVAAESNPVEPVWAPAEMPSAIDPFTRPLADIYD
ncbi:MAG: hypothetical protein HQ588_00985 [Deltaproteobacteria bacterium]|nr:hypothetical protein [Deltaproteobacteria bacterium]